ncbi:MAG: hypothetical protein ACKOUR_05685, partial [Planctomycetota bacterium]
MKKRSVGNHVFGGLTAFRGRTLLSYLVAGMLLIAPVAAQEVKPAVKPATNPEAKPAAQPNAQPTAQPAGKAEGKPESKTDGKAPAPQGPGEVDELALKQSKLADKYARLEELMARMATFEASSNPRRAELLKKAVQQSK